MYQKDIKKHFKWIVWVKFSIENFNKMMESYNPKSNLLPGIIYSHPILFFEELKEQKINLNFIGGEIKIPEIKLIPNNSIFYKYFSEGIDLEAYLKWQNILRPDNRSL